MPQASDELRDLMTHYFGDIDCYEPENFLKDQGYKLREDRYWEGKPGVTEYRQMTRKEWLCLLFLCDEWDYGGLQTERGENDKISK